MANDLVPQDNNSESEVITLPKQEEKYSIIPTIVSHAFNKYYWDKRNAEDANIIDDTIIMPQPERIGIDAPPPAKERGRTIDSASGDPINMPQPERQGLPIPPEVKLFQEKMEAKQKSPIIEKKKGGEVITLPKQEEKYSIIPTIASNTFNKYYWDKRNVEDANIIDDPINMPQPERIGIDAPPPEVKLFQEKMEAKQRSPKQKSPIIEEKKAKQRSPIIEEKSPKQRSPIIEEKKGGEVGKTLLKTLGRGASFLLPYLIKVAAAGIDNLAALPKTALEGSMSTEQKALYGGGLAGAFANVSAAAPLPVTDRMREISDALLLHRMQQKYIDMLKKQADYMKTLDLNGHQLDYLGRQASGIAFMNNKAPGAINGIKR